MNVSQLVRLSKLVERETFYGWGWHDFSVCRKSLAKVTPAEAKWDGWKASFPETPKPLIDVETTYEELVTWEMVFKDDTIHFTIKMYDNDYGIGVERGALRCSWRYIITDEEHFKPVMKKIIIPRMEREVFDRAARDEENERLRIYREAVQARAVNYFDLAGVRDDDNQRAACHNCPNPELCRRLGKCDPDGGLSI